MEKEKQELEFKNNLRKVIFPCCNFNKKEDFETITEIDYALEVENTD